MGTKLRAGNGNNNSLCVLFGSHCVGGGIIPLRISLLGVDGWVLFLGCFGLGRRGGGEVGCRSGLLGCYLIFPGFQRSSNFLRS